MRRIMMVVKVCWGNTYSFLQVRREDDSDEYGGVEGSGDGGVLSDNVPGPVGDDRVDPASDDDAVEEVGGKLAPTNSKSKCDHNFRRLVSMQFRHIILIFLNLILLNWYFMT